MPLQRPRRSLASPLVWVGGGALLGTLVGPSGLLAPTVALGVGSLLVAAGWYVGLAPRAWLGPLMAAIAALAVGGPRASVSPTGQAEITGLVIASSPERGVTLQIEEARDAQGAPLSLSRVQLDVEAAVAEQLRVRVELSPFAPFRNESPHPSYMPTQRLARGRDVLVRERREGVGPEAWLARAREHVRASLAASLADDVEGLVIAMVLGDASLSAVDAADARGAGLSHVVAVSGMHVTLVVGAIVALMTSLARRWTWLLRRGDPRVLAWSLGAVVAPLYAAFAGGSASAWRAAATASLTWLLAACGRRADPLAVTGLVVIGGCVLCPDATRSPAFVLSTLATAAVLSPAQVAPADALPRRSATRELVRAATRAAIATAPFTLWCFGTLPPLSIVANLVVVPVVAAVILPLGTLHGVLASVSVPCARELAAPTEAVVRAFLALSRYFAQAGEGLSPPLLDAPELFVVALVSLGVLTVRRARDVFVVLAVGALALSAAEWRLRTNERRGDALRVTFLDVGQGDAALLDLPDGQLWLIDTGGASFGSRRDPGREAIVPLLQARRRTHVDVLVVTHPHPDHHGGFAGLASRIAIRELWDSGQAAEESPDGAWARAHAGLLVPIHTPETLCGRPRMHGGARVELLSPCPRFDPGYEANDNSLVLRVSYGRRSFLLLGDAEAHTEARLAANLGHVDVVKVGHHGSRTSSTEGLVMATRPWLAVVSAGVGNRYGHPHAEVIERWERHAQAIARTDLDGSVTVWTDGERLEATTFSGRALEAPVGAATWNVGAMP